MSVSANQHLRVFVSSYNQPVGGTLPVGSAVVLIESAGFLPGMITYMAIATGACTDAAPAVPYKVAYKDASGIVHLSEAIDPDSMGYKTTSVSYAAATEKVAKITIGAVTVGEAYILKVRFPQYGGLIGDEDEKFFYGNYTVKTADTPTLVAAGLVANLTANLANASVSVITATSAAAVITLTGVAQPYIQAKFQGKQVHFFGSIASPEAAWAGEDATGGTLPHPGNGTYPQVAVREEFYAGYNTYYKNRYADWPSMTEPLLAASASGTYDLISHISKTPYGDANSGSQRQITEAYFNTNGTVVALS